jgi:hypothetical protein
MFEHKHEPVLHRRGFFGRMARFAAAAVALVAAALTVGMIGYRCFEGLSWLDAYFNAAMILTGMGPAQTPQTAGGKIFAGLYAMLSVLVVLSSAGLLLGPVFHRIIHRFHLEETREGRHGGHHHKPPGPGPSAPGAPTDVG